MNSVIEGILGDFLGIIIVSIWILALFALSEFLSRNKNMAAEKTRKLVHFGAGPIILSFPWLLSSSNTVGFLCVLFFLLLLLGKQTEWLRGVHSVERVTSGAYLYPFAVWICFYLSKGDPLLFTLPIAILAIADAAAALIGKKHGEHRYTIYDGERSLEGSLSFFVIAFVLSVFFFVLAGVPAWPELICIALLLAIMTTALEGISIFGLDNILIPYGGFLILERTLNQGLYELSAWFEGMILSFFLLFFSWKKLGLTEAAALSIFVSGSFAWAIGDWFWSAPLLSLYFLFFLLILLIKSDETLEQKRIQHQIEDTLPTVLGALIFVLLYATFQDESLFIPYITALSAGASIAMGRLAANRGLPLTPLILLGSLAPISPLFWAQTPFPFWKILSSSVLAVLLFYLLRHSQLVGRRFIITVTAGFLAWGLF